MIQRSARVWSSLPFDGVLAPLSPPLPVAMEALEARKLMSAVAALTADGRLLTFDSNKPSVILGTRTISGLASGETLLGIDVRPATGQLYGLGSAANLYTIDPNTGASTLIAALAADPADASSPFTALSGTRFGIDFNPVPDRLRVVSDNEQNLRINPTTGLVTTDTPLSFAPGAPHFGEDPTIVEAAYSNNVAGATSTALYDMDSNIGILVAQNPPNDGLLTKIAPFGKAGAKARGFDITPSGTALVAVEAEFPSETQFLLVDIDLTTAADTSHGRIGDGATPIADIAVLPSVQFSAASYAAVEGTSATVTVTRTEGNIGAFTVDFATSSGTAVTGTDFTATAGTLTFAAGETSKTFSVPVADDTEAEGDETVNLTLSNPGGGAVLGGPQAATLRISANDALKDRKGPQIVALGETGPSRGITGAVITFNEDLDPTRAQNPANYSLLAKPAKGKKTRISFNSATYDAVARTVTLTVAQPFQQTTFRTLEFRVKGTKGGVTDTNGNLLDGKNRGKRGADASLLFQTFTGTSVTITDTDGDTATVSIANGGSVDGIEPVKAPATQHVQFWILDPIALQSTLSGSVTKGTRGDGIVVIAEIIGLDKKEFTPISTNSAFQINRLTFSPNATGR